MAEKAQKHALAQNAHVKQFTQSLLAYSVLVFFGAGYCHAQSHAEHETQSKYRKRFIQECGKVEYNENCARFFEARIKKRKSQEYCKAHPEAASCIELLEESKRLEEERRAVSVHREIAEYCQSNPDTLRCQQRKKKRQRRYSSY